MNHFAKKYLVVFEPSATGFSAYVPDLPGCIASGDTLEQTEQNIRDGITFHLEGMRAEGILIPEPVSQSRVLEVVG